MPHLDPLILLSYKHDLEISPQLLTVLLFDAYVECGPYGYTHFCILYSIHTTDIKLMLNGSHTHLSDAETMRGW